MKWDTHTIQVPFTLNAVNEGDKKREDVSEIVFFLFGLFIFLIEYKNQ